MKQHETDPEPDDNITASGCCWSCIWGTSKLLRNCPD